MQRWIWPVTETLVWASLLVGVWVLTLNAVSPPEMGAAGFTGLCAGAAAAAARRALGGRWRPSPRWVGWLLALPVAVLADTGRVFAAVLSELPRRGEERGRLRRVASPRETDPARRAARQALSILAVSSTPGSYVVDADDDGELTVHALVEGSPSMVDVVAR